LNKLLPLFAFSILLLVPVSQSAFASHTLSGTGLDGHCLDPPNSGVDYSNCDLRGRVLEFASLSNSNLSGADLTGAFLRGVNLFFSDLSNADLTNADLTIARLIGADLTNAILTNADLIGANLADADLTNADLTDANLNSAILADADLTNADLTGANLNAANLNNAILFCIGHPICVEPTFHCGQGTIGDLDSRLCSPDLLAICGDGTIADNILFLCNADNTVLDAALAALAEAQAQRDAILTTLFEFLRVFGVI